MKFDTSKFKTLIKAITKSPTTTDSHDQIMQLSFQALGKNTRKYLDLAANRLYNSDNKKAMQFLSKAYYTLNSAKQSELSDKINVLMKDISNQTGIPIPKDYYWQYDNKPMSHK